MVSTKLMVQCVKVKNNRSCAQLHHPSELLKPWLKVKVKRINELWGPQKSVLNARTHRRMHRQTVLPGPHRVTPGTTRKPIIYSLRYLGYNVKQIFGVIQNISRFKCYRCNSTCSLTMKYQSILTSKYINTGINKADQILLKGENMLV